MLFLRHRRTCDLSLVTWLDRRIAEREDSQALALLPAIGQLLSQENHQSVHPIRGPSSITLESWFFPKMTYGAINPNGSQRVATDFNSVRFVQFRGDSALTGKLIVSFWNCHVVPKTFPSAGWVGLGGSGIKKGGGGWQRRIDAFCAVWLSSGSRRQNPTHALSGQSNRGKFLSLGNSWRQKKKAWLREWSGVSELGGQRDGQQRRAGVLLSLLFRVWRWISFFCYWIGWPPAS